MPADESGNGGGFVFDARSLAESRTGRAFQRLTGKDAPVIEYLDQQESVHSFWPTCWRWWMQACASYQRRGFKNLMVSFGCTGGQHRSVYLAEQLAKHLRGTSGVEVVVRHIELEKMGSWNRGK